MSSDSEHAVGRALLAAGTAHYDHPSYGRLEDVPESLQTMVEVLAALLTAVNHDPNVNVRLAAVDALRKFAGSPEVRNTLDQTLAGQDSPLVQIALIDLIVDVRDKGAAPSLLALERSPAANKDVKARAVWGLAHLQ